MKEFFYLALGATTLLLLDFGVPGDAHNHHHHQGHGHHHHHETLSLREDCKGTITIGDKEVGRGNGWLRISSVEEVVTTGDCCWKLSEGRGFRGGQSHIVRPPHSGPLPDHVDWMPQSVFKVQCSE